MQKDKPTTEERSRERRKNRQMSRRKAGRETTSKAEVCEEAASVDSINVCLCRVFRRTDDVQRGVSARTTAVARAKRNVDGQGILWGPE